MWDEEEKLKRELVSKEEALLENNIRNDPKRIAEIIDADCIEITASGRQNSYRPGESFENLDGALYIDSHSVRMRDLSEDCKLLLYIGVRVVRNNRIKSYHSSVWKEVDGKWKIVFHQGTDCAK